MASKGARPQRLFSASLRKGSRSSPSSVSAQETRRALPQQYYRHHSSDSIHQRPSRFPRAYEDPIVIVVMGMTGSGKSSFINLLANDEAQVGHSLESTTTNVMFHNFTVSSARPAYLVDTPGFDDTNRSDTEILSEIAGALTFLWHRRIKIAGLVYLHRITDVRMSGSAVRNLEMFQRLSGPHCFPQVTLVSTMWQTLGGTEDVRLAKERESMLISEHRFWGQLVRGGSRVTRHYGDQESAKAIIQRFVSRPQRVVMTIQKEMVDAHLPLAKTAAGQYLDEGLAKLKEQFEMDVKQLQEAAKEAMQEQDEQMSDLIMVQEKATVKKIKDLDNSSDALWIGARELSARTIPGHVLPRRSVASDNAEEVHVAVSVSDAPAAYEARLRELEEQMSDIRRDRMREEQDRERDRERDMERERERDRERNRERKIAAIKSQEHEYARAQETERRREARYAQEKEELEARRPEMRVRRDDQDRPRPGLVSRESLRRHSDSMAVSCHLDQVIVSEVPRINLRRAMTSDLSRATE